MRIDLHTHSSISDGTDTPADLVDRARQVGLDVVALTDHDTFAGLDEAVAGASRSAYRWSGGWSCPAAGTGRASTCWRTGPTRRFRIWPRSWSRSAAAGWAGWPGCCSASPSWGSR